MIIIYVFDICLLVTFMYTDNYSNVSENNQFYAVIIPIIFTIDNNIATKNAIKIFSEVINHLEKTFDESVKCLVIPDDTITNICVSYINTEQLPQKDFEIFCKKADKLIETLNKKGFQY